MDRNTPWIRGPGIGISHQSSGYSASREQWIVNRDRSLAVKGRHQIPSQQLGLGGRPDLLDVSIHGVDRLESFNRSVADGSQEPKAPLHESRLGTVDQHINPAFNIGIGGKSMTTETPLRLDLVNQVIAVGEPDALDGPRKSLDHGGRDAAMQSDQSSADPAVDPGEIKTTVDHLGEPVAS